MNDKVATIIIPHHDRHDHLKNLLDVLDNTLFDIIIVSGGSFAENCNRGAKLAETERLLFINDDTVPKINDLIYMCDILNFVDVVGSTQITKNNSKYYGIGFESTTKTRIFLKDKIQYYPIICTEKNKSLFPSGFLFGIKKNAWERIGGFDSNFKTGYEDVDFGIKCVDLKLSISILDLEIFHHESESTGRFKFTEENTNLLYEKYNQKKLKELYENPYYCI